MKKPLTSLMILAPLLLAGCASAPDEKDKTPVDLDPRVGEEVTQVCFIRNIDSWSNPDNDNDALILRMNNRDSYKLKLGGSCDPDWAMVHIAVISRGGANCFSAGDRIKTDSDTSRGYGSACIITRINKWDPDAVSGTE